MPEPEIVRIVREFKDGLAALEAAQMNEMARRWLQVEAGLSAEIAALAYEVNEIRVAGGIVSTWKLAEMDRYRELLRQTRIEMTNYIAWAEGQVAAAQLQWGILGRQMALDSILSAYGGGVIPNFATLPIEAIQAMVGLAGDGSPLLQLLMNSWPDAVDGLTEALLKAVAQGINPRDTAKAMADGLADGLNRMLVIARTEQIRAFRESAYQQYVASGVVEGFYRISAHDDRVCAACLFAEGEFYPLDSGERLDDHPQGRCAMVPKVKGMPAVEFQLGKDWFKEQDEETQRNIIGDAKWDAWQDGKFELEDLVTKTQDDTWGGSVKPTPLSELVG
jgi:hypothetical protein